MPQHVPAYSYQDEPVDMPNTDTLDDLFADEEFCALLVDAINTNFAMEVEGK